MPKGRSVAPLWSLQCRDAEVGATHVIIVVYFKLSGYFNILQELPTGLVSQKIAIFWLATH